MTQRQKKQQTLLAEALARPGVREIAEVYEATRRAQDCFTSALTAQPVVVTGGDSTALSSDLLDW